MNLIKRILTQGDSRGFSCVVPDVKIQERLKAILLIAMMTVASHSIAGNVIVVGNNADAGTGSLREAAASAADGDTIRFDAAISGDTIILTTGAVVIASNVVMKGSGVNATIISGNNASRIFSIEAGDTVTIESLTLLQGMTPDSGGAVYNNGSLTMIACNIQNNSAAYGGGILNKGVLALNTCTLSNNTATSGSGGGIFSPTGSSCNASLSSFLNNSAAGQGGGISTLGANSFNNITVSGNSSSEGGGIYATAALNLNFSTITSNTATSGNGGGFFSSGNGKVTACVISGNSASNRGGGFFSSFTMLITSSSINDNTGSESGGGIYSSSPMSLISSSVCNNVAGEDGGGIYNSNSALVNYSTISGNQSNQSGGGIFNSGTVTFSRTTIAFNEAGTNGGGAFTSDTLRFSNTLFSNNAAQQGPEIFGTSGKPVSLGYNLVKNNAESGFTPATGDVIGTPAIPVDALLGPLQINGGDLLTHEPRCGSPAIDAGNPAGAPAFDQRGAPRIHGNGIDIGSVESQFDPIEILAVITHASHPDSTDGSIQLQVSGGTSPYTYLWNTGNQTNILSNAAKGNYSVTVKDFFECEASAIFTIGAPGCNGLVITAIITDATQPGSADGSIELTVTGGTPPFTYSWSTGHQGSILSNVHKGTYSVTVEDYFLCEAADTFSVGGPDSINNIFNITTDPGFTVYPNPANGYLMIHHSLEERVSAISIFDISGKMMIENISFLILSDGIKVDLDKLKEGYYTIILQAGSLKYSGRFVKLN